jgi:predicted transcriptional regulator
MEAHYKTLQTIYNITHQDPQPTSYQCKPREIILRQFQDWSMIQQDIQLLEDEGLITTTQKDTLIITITATGIQKINSANITYQD